ncbi:caspase-3-like [Oppia nitens]|uniref:caspase-3-like n=1 Tax=Oppia nitens TaxID=1686743 RepID=UPI0023DCE0E2|nr:caspase-3-like [Oppia nitens]
MYSGFEVHLNKEPLPLQQLTIGDNDEQKERDAIDAKLFKFSSIMGQKDKPIGSITIPINSLVYDMDHQQRGKCIIFNHRLFDTHTGCKPRMGTERDAEAVAYAFNRLQFEVVNYLDKTYKEIRDIMITLSLEDHSHRDCVVVVVLTHGDEDVLWARNAKYPIQVLFEFLNGDRCPTLVGKPKLFIIQACRGSEFDAGTKLAALGKDVVDNKPAAPIYKIPTIADFLVYYSTAPGHYSFRNTQNGSYFIQTLADVLTQCYNNTNYDLLTIFTIVNQRVAFEFESNSPKDKQYHHKKQMPCISSMLTRLLHLNPKFNNNSVDTDKQDIQSVGQMPVSVDKCNPITEEMSSQSISESNQTTQETPIQSTGQLLVEPMDQPIDQQNTNNNPLTD